MSVLRQSNLLGQQRIDVPHIRAVESSICADFDLLAGTIMAGLEACVVSGFEVITTGAVGSAATALQIITASSVMLHPLASESGTIFSVPSDRNVEVMSSSNTRLNGSFTANATNYVGIDLRRTADSTTADLVQFLDPNTDTEKSQTVPLGRTLDYVIVVSTQDFSSTPGVAPIAKIVTDANNLVTTITDARQMMFRLGKGGSIPDIYNAYSFSGGRTESTSNNAFDEGDKVITSLKGWMNATMTRLWELGGGQQWYSPTADRNVTMMRGYTGTTFVSGEWFEWDGTHLHWKSLKFIFDNSTAYYNDVVDQTTNSAGLTNLANGDCIYVDIDRTTNRTGGTALQPVKAALITLGTPTVPGSRYIIAWRSGANVYTRDSSFPVGSIFTPATDSFTGAVRLTYPAGVPAIPKVAPQDVNGRIHNTATAGNAPGLEGFGNGSGAGVQGTGGATAGTPGVKGTGGAANGVGVQGVGVGNAVGVQGIGATTGAGVSGAGGATSGPGTVGAGGAPNGDGLYGIGAGAGAGASLVAGPTGAGLLIETDGGEGIVITHNGGTTKSTLVVRDAGGDRRVVYDRNGYRMGRTCNLDVNWFWSTISLSTAGSPSGWTVAASDVDMSVGIGNPSSTYPANVLMLGAVAATDAGDYAYAATNGPILHSGFTGLVFAMEWEARTSLVSTSDRDNNLAMGLSSDPTAITGGADILIGAPQFIGFGIPDGNTENGWTCYTKTGTGAGITFTVPSAQVGGGVGTTTDMQKFRIEIWGSGTPTGATTVYFFIDSAAASTTTLRATHTTDIPSTDLSAILINQVITGGTTQDVEIGPIRMEWNRYLNAPAR